MTEFEKIEYNHLTFDGQRGNLVFLMSSNDKVEGMMCAHTAFLKMVPKTAPFRQLFFNVSDANFTSNIISSSVHNMWTSFCSFCVLFEKKNTLH